jgi:hypothetical protein
MVDFQARSISGLSHVFYPSDRLNDARNIEMPTHLPQHRAGLLNLFLVSLLCAACSRSEAPTPKAGAATPAATPGIEKAVATRAVKPMPGEPPESVLIEVITAQYDAIRKQGGANVTVTASGRSLVLMPRVHSAKKNNCRPVPQRPEGEFECSLDMMVTMREGDRTPGQHAERVNVYWDFEAGEWKAGSPPRKRAKP